MTSVFFFFCGYRETVFHCYLECIRLMPLFDVLSIVFFKCGEEYTQRKYILGAGNSQKQKIEWQLINFLVGQAKLAIHGFHVTSHSGAAAICRTELQFRQSAVLCSGL